MTSKYSIIRILMDRVRTNLPSEARDDLRNLLLAIDEKVREADHIVERAGEEINNSRYGGAYSFFEIGSKMLTSTLAELSMAASLAVTDDEEEEEEEEEVAK